MAACVSPGTTKARLKSWLETYSPLLEALGRAGFALTLLHVSARPEVEESAARELARAARQLGSGAADEATMERIRRAIRAWHEGIARGGRRPFAGPRDRAQDQREAGDGGCREHRYG